MSRSKPQKSKTEDVIDPLAKLRQDYEAIKTQIQALDYILPGTLQTRQYRCGKIKCRCRTHGQLHGPYEQWTRKVDGKTRNISLDTESAPTVREWIQNNRKLRQICHQMEEISLKALDIITHMNNGQ